MSGSRKEADGGEFGLRQEARIGAEPGTAAGGSSAAAAIRQGATKQPSRCCTVWVHGWGTSSELWGDCERLLPEDAHTRFSYAGCGTIAAMRGRLRELIAVQPGPVRLIGWSLGGMLALEALLEQVETDGRFAERTKETARGDQNHASRIVHARNGTRAADTPGLADIRGSTHMRAETDLQLSGGAASVGRIVQAVLVGSTLRFAASDRQYGWPERVLRQMRVQLKTDAGGVLRRFSAAMLSADERAELADAASVNRLRESLRGNEMARAANWERTDFSPSALDAGLAYLQESDLSVRWARMEAVAVEASSTKEDCPECVDDARRSSASLPDVRWLHGTADPICPPGALAGVADWRIRWLNGAGHAPFWTQPEAFAESIRSIAYGDR